jgi:tRNA threonylcarbamoyladenosine biosynthesis protein TsaE
LNGTLGAGKTRLVQAIAAACGVPREEVVSPTFVLCQQYQGTRTINHLDAYRLKDEGEFRALGADELFAVDLTIVEWADKIAGALPEDHVRIDIEVTGSTSRRFAIREIAGTKPDPAVR